MATIKKVGVLGCGLMGSGIAQIAAQAGYETVVGEVGQTFLAQGTGGLSTRPAKVAAAGKVQAKKQTTGMTSWPRSTASVGGSNTSPRAAAA